MLLRSKDSLQRRIISNNDYFLVWQVSYSSSPHYHNRHLFASGTWPIAFITTLHRMPAWTSDEKGVCPSVCLSVCLSVRRFVCQTSGLWQNEERSVQIFMPYERSFSLPFWEEEWLMGATPSTWNFGSTDPRWSEIADFHPIFARSASTVTPSEKSSINTNRKSTAHFPMSLRWSRSLCEGWASCFMLYKMLSYLREIALQGAL